MAVHLRKGVFDPELIRYLYMNTGVAFKILFGNRPRPNAEALLSAEWDGASPTTQDEFDAFYRDSLFVAEELALWHQKRNGERLRRVIHAGTIAKQLSMKSFCEVGAGIGTDGVALARLGFDCAFLAEINQPCLAMIEKMAALAMIPKLVVLDLAKVKNRDVSTCFGKLDWLYSSDVFEHILDLESWLDPWIRKFRLVIVYAPFGKSEKNHAHTAYTKQQFNRYMDAQGFEKLKVLGLGIPPMVYRRKT